MIIAKGKKVRVQALSETTPILFVFDGQYIYVESGIVENELRTMGNWKTAGQGGVYYREVYAQQGTEIPQELGDWLVANQDLAEKVLIVKRGDFGPEDVYNTGEEQIAYDDGVIAGIFECGEILSRPLSAHYNNNQTPDDTEQTEDGGQ